MGLNRLMLTAQQGYLGWRATFLTFWRDGLVKGGKYEAIRRDLYTGRRAVYDCLRGLLAR